MSRWNAETFQRRIADSASRRRWPAGSPNPDEISAYLAAVPADHPRELAVVLGMTPELRTLVLQHFSRVISIDHSTDAHWLYADWVPDDLREREQRLLGDWRGVTEDLHGRVDAVFGDGVLGNCRDADDATNLLAAIRQLVHERGLLITRHACYPDGFAGMIVHWHGVVAAAAAGRMDAAEAGFALRLAAFVESAWDPSTCVLDCAKVYASLHDLHAAGRLSSDLLEYSLRYHFTGTNWIPDETRWIQTLRKAGWRHQRRELSGKEWYRYYPFYTCTVTQQG